MAYGELQHWERVYLKPEEVSGTPSRIMLFATPRRMRSQGNWLNSSRAQRNAHIRI